MIGDMYSVGVAYFLWFLSGCGVLGFHRFYLRKFRTGLLWMFSLGLLTVGSIYDFFTLSSQVQRANMGLMLNGSQPAYPRDRGGKSWRYAGDTELRGARKKESLERSILRLAKENRGILSPGEVSLAADVDLETVKKALDTLVDKGFAELRVRKSGVLVYTLPEFMGKNEDLEDF
jgi:hypothetical protein